MANLDDWKSQSGYVLFLNGGAISWRLKEQEYLFDSTTYSEYIACYMAAKEIIWCRQMLIDLGYIQKKPTILYSDSLSILQ